MSRTLVLLWLGQAAAEPVHRPDLDAWAAARGVRLANPHEPASAARSDQQSEHIERLLEEARSALGALDEALAEARLAAAEQALRDYPALAESAWLMAEACELGARLAERRGDVAGRAPELRQRASTLEGPRALEFGLEESGRQPASRVVLEVQAARGGDELWWDGVPVSGPLETAAGEHHGRVLRDGRLVWSGWLRVSENQRELALQSPAAEPCSTEDLAVARIEDDALLVGGSVGCPAWAVARPASAAGVEVATCHHASCGPLLRWRRGFGTSYRGPPQRHVPTPAPSAVVTWTLLGIGVAATAALVLAESGAFDDPAPGRVTRRYYGPAP